MIADGPPPAIRFRGKVVAALGTLVRVVGVPLHIGDICRLIQPGGAVLLGEVIGLDAGQAIVLPLGSMVGLSCSTMVESSGQGFVIPPALSLLGRVVDGFCRPLDGLDIRVASCPVDSPITCPLSRPLIDSVFATGVKAIDSLLTCGVGQRVGIFAPAGGGKTSLLSMIARFANVDAIVIGLIGERGREVQEFLETALGPEQRKKAVIVVATSDRPAGERIKAAHVASAVAESLRAQGKHVLLLIDSLTRFARALREVGLAAGEPPARRGFPPSVFANLPILVERAGKNEHGAITGFYTVLSEDADNSDPVCEEVRSLLDGHIILSAELAAAGHFPAIDILASRSRVMGSVCDAEHLRQAQTVRKWLADYQKSELLIRIGEYRQGTDLALDQAVQKRPEITKLLLQQATAECSFEQVLLDLQRLTM